MLRIWLVLLATGGVFISFEVITRLRQDSSHLSALTVPAVRRLEDVPRRFADDVTRRIGRGRTVFATADVGNTFESQIGVRLAYRGMPIGLATDTQWRTLERGSALEIGRTLATLDIRYVLIQTAQPRPRVFQLCVHDQEPLVRSGLLTVDATTRYFFELYGLGDCREGR